jgi:carboxymethylenebutenolidase
MERLKASDFPKEVLALFDRYVHGQITRRDFLDKAAKFTVGGVSAAALLPQYAESQQTNWADTSIRAEYVEYPSPQGAGTMRGYMARPADSDGPLPGVLVVHENRGLNPHIEDVVRRAAIAGFIAFGPDALYPLGGYPGNDDDGRQMQSSRDGAEMTEDFVAAAEFLQNHDDCTGRVGVTGFCYGGGVANTLAVRVPTLGASVPFYGGQPRDPADVARINAPLLIQYAGEDARINAGWPAYEEALEANNKEYTMHMYAGANHGFHNDSTPRYDAAAAQLAWGRTIDFFNQHLR